MTQEEAQKYAEEEGLMWMEASAKTGEGVQDIFMAIGMCAPQTSPRATRIFETFVRRTASLVYTTPVGLVTDSLLHLVAKKLPLTQSQAKTGTVRGATSGPRGVDLNKGQNLQSTEACAC